METILEGQNIIWRKPKPLAHPRVSVTSAAGLARNIRGKYWRSRLGSSSDAVLAVTIGTNRSAARAAGCGFTMDTLAIDGSNILMTLTAGLRNVCARDRGTGVSRRSNPMRPMAIGTDSARLSRRDSTRVYAFKISLNRSDHRDAKLFSERGIGMTGGTGLSNIFMFHRRSGI
jgi:hypothetical protein